MRRGYTDSGGSGDAAGFSCLVFPAAERPIDILSSETGIFSGRNMAFQLADSLDHAAMREGAKFIVGTHDFKSFEASGGNHGETTVRTISDLTVEEKGDRTVIEVTETAFCIIWYELWWAHWWKWVREKEHRMKSGAFWTEGNDSWRDLPHPHRDYI